MKRILLTGFEPYGNTPINPAEQVVRRLDGSTVEGTRVVSRIVPNTFFKCIETVQAAIAELEPEAVVMLGEFPGRAVVTVERIAQDLNDGTRYDHRLWSLVPRPRCPAARPRHRHGRRPGRISEAAN